MSKHQESYNKGGLIAFVGSMVFSTVFILYLMFFQKGVTGLDTISEETAGPEATQAVADAGSGLPPGFDAAKVASPWKESPDMIAHGKNVYKTNCAVCHGDGYLGDGPAGKAIVPPPRNLVEGKWKQGGTSVALFKTLHDGVSGTSMAGFSQIPKADRWALVQMIRSVTKNKVADNEKELEKFAATAN